MRIKATKYIHAKCMVPKPRAKNQEPNNLQIEKSQSTRFCESFGLNILISIYLVPKLRDWSQVLDAFFQTAFPFQKQFIFAL
jgi:hypothetical protein